MMSIHANVLLLCHLYPMMTVLGLSFLSLPPPKSRNQEGRRYCPLDPATRRSNYCLWSRPPVPVSPTSHAMTNNGPEESDSNLDMFELQRRIEQQQTQYLDLFLSDDDEDNMERLERVHIIMFHVDSPDEGIHAIEFPKGSGLNIVLGFESEEECINFVEMLKQDTMRSCDPTPIEAPLEQLEVYCNAMQLPIKIVPSGTHIRPPAENVDKFTLDPNIRKARTEMEKIMLDSTYKDENIANESDDSWQ